MSNIQQDLMLLKQLMFGRQSQSDDQNDALIKYAYKSIPDKYKNPLNTSSLKQAILENPESDIASILLSDTDVKALQSGECKLLMKQNQKTGKASFAVLDRDTLKQIKQFKEEHKSLNIDYSVPAHATVSELVELLKPLVPSKIREDLKNNEAAQCLFVAPIFFGGATT